MIRLSAWMAALSVAVLAGCTGNPDRVAGSGSVTTNGLSGRVLRDGLPASGVSVKLYPIAYDPSGDGPLPDSLGLATDRSGAFAFEGVDTGSYNLIAADPGGGLAVLRAGIAIRTGRDSIAAGDLALVPTGSIRVRLPEDARKAGARVYLPGTAAFRILDSADAGAGGFILARIPAGDFDSLIYAGDGPVRNLLTAPLRVGPEAVGTSYPYAAWSRAYQVAVTGTSEPIAGFPLLVRLDAASFDFASAAADGSDLRVTLGDSATPTPFEIAAWDAAAKSAELWIKADTIRSGAPRPAACLFAGRPGIAAAPEANRPVFDTAAGFAGVWHLDEAPIAGKPTLSDRTQNGFHGTASAGLDPAASVAGAIGKALKLDGAGAHAELASTDRFLPRAGLPLTVSAWIKPTAFGAGDSIRHRLATFKTDTVGISALALGIGADGRFSHYTRASDSVFHWPAPASIDSAYHFGLTFAAGEFIGYVNGSEAFRVAAPLGKGGPLPVLLGAHLPGQLGFAGWIDEFRIESAARSPAWMRLNWDTQRPGSRAAALIRFAP